MWIGFSAVEGAEAGPAVQGAAFSLESCQNWLPGEPHPATAERCVRLGPAGQCNTDLCSAPHSYVCELRPGGALGQRRWGHLSWMEAASPKHGRELPAAVLPRPQGPSTTQGLRAAPSVLARRSPPPSRAPSLAVQWPLCLLSTCCAELSPPPMRQTKLGGLGGSCQVAPSGVRPCLGPHNALLQGPGPHCTLVIPGPVWDAENFLVGAPSGDLQGPLSPLAQQEALSAPQELVEVG